MDVSEDLPMEVAEEFPVELLEYYLLIFLFSDYLPGDLSLPSEFFQHFRKYCHCDIKERISVEALKELPVKVLKKLPVELLAKFPSAFCRYSRSQSLRSSGKQL